MAWLLTGCVTDVAVAQRALGAAGFANVELAGAYPWGACDDWSARAFVGEMNGRRVRGVLCCSAADACTIRY